MSNFTRRTIHPVTGAIEEATWLDDHFGKHRYGVRFADGSIHDEYDVAMPWPCSYEKHDEQRRSGDWEERAGGTLYCPYCGILIGKFRR